MNGESHVQAPDDSAKPTATIDADGVKDAMPEPTAAAGDEPDGSLDEQDPSTWGLRIRYMGDRYDTGR